MVDTTYDIAITSSDKTAKGLSSAEKRFEKVTSKLGVKTERLGAGMDASVRRAILSGTREVERSNVGLVQSFGKIEQASARAFGGGGGLITRITSLGQASAEAAGGFSAAAAEGGLLAGAMSLLGGAAVTATGVLAGAAVVTDKLMKGWAGNIAGASRFADTMGISTKALQEFQGAAERLGIDKDTAGGALGGLSQTLNDARYGRNNQALAVLMRLGVKLRTNADGTVDTAAMAPDIATAIARQNSSGRRTALTALGIPLSAAAIFTQGGAALSRDMADVGRYGAVAGADTIARARAWQRRRTMIGQMLDRAGMDLGDETAKAGTGALDSANRLGRGLINSGKNPTEAVSKLIDGFFSQPAAAIDRGGAKIEHGGDMIDRAVGKLTDAVNWIDKHWLGGTGGDTPSPAGGGGARPGSFPDMIRRLEASRDGQRSPKGATGAMQVMAGTLRDPGMGVTPARDGSFAEINRVGRDYANALLRKYHGDEVLAAAAYNAGPGNIDRMIRLYGDPSRGQISEDAFIARLPWRETRNYARRAEGMAAPGPTSPTGMAALERAAAEQRLHLVIEHRNSPPGTKYTATTDRGAVAISHAPIN